MTTAQADSRLPILSPCTTDVIVATDNPAALQRYLAMLEPHCMAVMVEDETPGSLLLRDSGYVIRCFHGLEFLRHAFGPLAFCGKIIKECPVLF